MVRLARAEVYDSAEIAIAHVYNRTVRRCFLMGDDSVSGKNFDHRKVWIEEYLQQFAAAFGIDLLGFAILSNHFHLILRNRRDVVATWDEREVARRWLMLCQRVAQRANQEDDESGRFFQDRYRATRLVDEASLLACAAYVDLNPIRAAMCQTLESSDHTSVQRRI